MIRSCSLKPREIYEPAGVKQTISSQFFLEVGGVTKHLITGPAGNSEFCFPSTSMFPSAPPWKTLRVLRKQNLLFPLGPVINCLIGGDKRQPEMRRLLSDPRLSLWDGVERYIIAQQLLTDSLKFSEYWSQQGKLYSYTKLEIRYLLLVVFIKNLYFCPPWLLTILGLIFLLNNKVYFSVCHMFRGLGYFWYLKESQCHIKEVKELTITEKINKLWSL